ncbi:MAG: MFS transporter, partial [Caulobacteraceae bacterium]
LKSHARILILGLMLIASATVSTYVFSFMTTYAITTLNMPAGISLGATVASGVMGVIGGLAGGVLSDRIGRRPLMIWPRIAHLLVTWPAFFLMVRNHDAPTLLGATAVMALLSALSTSSILVAITESLRKEIRGAGMGTIYATAVAIFGGTTQPVLAWLIHLTGNPLSPAWYMMAFTVIGLIASLLMVETSHGRTRTGGVGAPAAARGG